MILLLLSLIQAIDMPVQCQSFYDLADKLYQDNPQSEEILFRSTINRAYYGAFHATKIYLGLKGEIPHSVVISKLERKHRYLGGLLGSLFTTRKDADYEIGASITQSEARKALKKADIIIHSLCTHP